MNDLPPQNGATKIDTKAIKSWLATPITVTFPGWVFASAGVAALLLLLIALD